MNYRVTLTRARVIEEKIKVIASAANSEDAIADCQHLVVGNLVDWEYSRTLETSATSVEVNLSKEEV